MSTQKSLITRLRKLHDIRERVEKLQKIESRLQTKILHRYKFDKVTFDHMIAQHAVMHQYTYNNRGLMKVIKKYPQLKKAMKVSIHWKKNMLLKFAEKNDLSMNELIKQETKSHYIRFLKEVNHERSESS